MRPAFSALLLFLLALVLGVPAAAQSGSAKDKSKDKKSDSNATTSLVIHIVGGEKSEPVPNASVYLRFQQKDALLFLLHRKKKIELDLKTDNEGNASFPIVPFGKLLVQIVCPGWQTFGEYYEVKEQPKQTINIKLKRPTTHWF